MSDPISSSDKPDVPDDGERAAPSGDELPPLPDGGLSGTMPAWLQQAPSRPVRSRAPETVELTSLAEGIEVPEWLSELARRVDADSTAEQPTTSEVQSADVRLGDDGPAQDRPLQIPRTYVGEGLVPSRPSPKPPTTVETRSEEDRPLAGAVSKDAPEADEPEPALKEPALEAVDTQVPRIDAAPEAPEPALRFQVRNMIRAVPDPETTEPGVAAPQAQPVMRYQMRAPAPQAPRSIGATILLVLLLIALAAVGVWYYW